MGKEQEVIKAAKTGDIRTLEKYLGQSTKRSSMIGNIKKNIHPNIQDELGYTLLHHATLNGHRETVSFLLRCGASTTISDTSGSYPLHLASWKGDIEIVRLLTSQGPSRANVDQQSHTEDTALHFASQYGYCGVVEFLLERHANPMMKNIRGETPLDLAAQFGHIDTVHILISHCPEILRLSRPEMSPLHLAARNGHSVVVLSLINAGIPINSICKNGTALHEAALCGKENTVKLLLDKGIDINMKDSEHRTVQELLADFNNEKYVKIKNLIRKYQNGEVQPTGRYMKPKRQRLLAIPKRDSKASLQVPNSTMSDLPPLQYMQDEAIIVCGRLSSKIYIGKLHDMTGTFPLKDTRLYQDIDGHLERVYPKNIIESPEDGSLHVLQQPLLNVQSQEWERKSMVDSRPSLEEQRPARSLSTSDTHTGEEALERKKKSRLTDKEKRFILSKDTGAYSELAPVNAPKDVEVRELPSEHKQDKGPSGGYVGKYYLLEVGNFDDVPPPPSISPPPLPSKRSKLPQYENVQLKEKPRSISDGSLLDVPPLNNTTNRDVPQKRSKSFQNYEYPPSPPTSTTEESLPQYDHNTHDDYITHRDDQLRHYQDTIDRRGPMPLPYDEVTPMRDNGQFEIGVDDDVMVSSINPNYSKIVHGGQQESQQKKNNVNATGVWIIPQDDEYPFAGLVESSSYNDGGLSQEYNSTGYMECPPVSRNRLKSVWDDKRVNQEWNKIDDVLKDMTTNITHYETVIHDDARILPTRQTLPSEEGEKSSVFLWLSSMGLQGYTSTFESNGFDDIKFMGGGIMDIEDLKQMGIYDNDQGTIMIKVAILRPPPRLTDVSNVEDWLLKLNLSQLKDCFQGLTLDKISTLWEIQLSTLFGIELLGYRKRLLYGINELRRTHPEWAPNTSLVVSQNKVLPSRGPIADVNFVKDYSQILSARSDNETNQLEIFSAYDSPVSMKWTQSKLRTETSPPKINYDYTDGTPYDGVISTQSKPKTQTIPPEKSYDQTTPSEEPLRGQTTPSEEPLRGQTTPSEEPLRGTEYATASDPPVPQKKSVVTVQEALPSSESKNYNAWYLGSAVVKGIAGKHSAEEACLKLRTQTDGIAKIPQIILSISWKGVKFVNAETKVVISTHLIRDISHCCPDIEDPRVFAYMSKDKETNCSYCHVFMVPSKDVADEIISTVGQAFEIAYQAVVRARSKYKSPTGSPKKTSKSSALKRSFRKLKQSSQDVADDGIK